MFKTFLGKYYYTPIVKEITLIHKCRWHVTIYNDIIIIIIIIIITIILI